MHIYGDYEYACVHIPTITFFVCFFRFIYETERHNGVAELLEILGRWALRNYLCVCVVFGFTSWLLALRLARFDLRMVSWVVTRFKNCGQHHGSSLQGCWPFYIPAVEKWWLYLPYLPHKWALHRTQGLYSGIVVAWPKCFSWVGCLSRHIGIRGMQHGYVYAIVYCKSWINCVWNNWYPRYEEVAHISVSDIHGLCSKRIHSLLPILQYH